MSYLEVLLYRLKPELKLVGYALVLFIITIIIGNIT